MSKSGIAPLLVALALVAAPASAGEQAHAGSHDLAAGAPPVAAPAGRWATDAPLRDGMRAIRAVVAALGHDGPGHLGAGEASALAAQVDGHISRIVANCRLAPDADAALHGVLGGLSRGARALAEDPGDPSALPGMRAALADYARLFDDPAFQVPST